METVTLEDIGRLIVVVIGAALVFGLGPVIWRLLPRLQDRYFERRPVGDLYRHLTSTDGPFEDKESPLHTDNSPATTTLQNSNNGVAMPQLDSNELLRAKAEVLAIMVKDGKIGETDGIRKVFGVAPSSSNPKYLAARAALKSELEKLSNLYPQRTPEQERLRKELGLTSR